MLPSTRVPISLSAPLREANEDQLKEMLNPLELTFKSSST